MSRKRPKVCLNCILCVKACQQCPLPECPFTSPAKAQQPEVCCSYFLCTLCTLIHIYSIVHSHKHTYIFPYNKSNIHIYIQRTLSLCIQGKHLTRARKAKRQTKKNVMIINANDPKTHSKESLSVCAAQEYRLNRLSATN